MYLIAIHSFVFYFLFIYKGRNDTYDRMDFFLEMIYSFISLNIVIENNIVSEGR